jgi:DNA-binding MarR family transcriptional regulator
MTRMVDALEKAGLVARQQDAVDRRRFRISATTAGVRLMHKGRERRVAALAGLLSRTDRDQRATLLAALDILERLQRDPHA